MPELLLELRSEEIPARMQGKAAADLEKAVNKALLDAGFMPEGVKAFAGPRRLTLVADGLPARQPDRREEKKGPRVGAPEKAVEGFLKSAGLASLDECEQREDKKGAYWVAVIDRKGALTSDLIAGFVPDIVRNFSWPKSMRWGDGDLRWVRPLHSILCAFDGEVIPFEIDGIVAGDETQGHRFLAPDVIQARSFETYAAALKKAKVVLDIDERKEMIASDAATLCKAQGLELVEDQGLLNEVAGLAEWPVAMMGSFDEKFLTVPDEVLTASMRGHQKYFSVKDPKTGALANRFVYVANIEAPDGGKAMREGYERVLTARLSDAWFLYNQDLKTPLAERANNLEDVKFFAGLGSIFDKSNRIVRMATYIAPLIGADRELCDRAAWLSKADLVTGMVYEFPELQGVMGRYYALEEGEPEEVANAIRDHYKPAGQDDEVPTAPVSIAVALADKIDTLTAFWTIDKKPTGSSDPFALRRAALGVISLILTSNIQKFRLGHKLADMIFWLLEDLEVEQLNKSIEPAYSLPPELADRVLVEEYAERVHKEILFDDEKRRKRAERTIELAKDLLSFFYDRFKVYLRDKGHKHDQIDAVLTDAEGNLQDDLVLIVAKLEALADFLKTDDGANLAAAYKRAANILKAEEKKDKTPADPNAVEKGALAEKEEKALFAALKDAEATAEKAVAGEDFEAAMSALAKLRKPLDAFFETVTVNAEDAKLRANRLSLLARLTAATATVADFSKLEG
ncbi:glycine--tRNA ligase subunit beta [Hyphococcus luteus]|uniref:Glycine--tRNA ligase beta subunit n=1 Tax=Hyphococcus luteus TaxID=2058213 RepID=A0A2S7K9G7_9PROT|nr:glycine--tRNA ligase subunit beta [Marinicaulis flavus]PQA89145.1 glycine--tRNA ligase subunit beta [Marinicaulis flavus]